MKTSAKLLIHGRVQGVGFRWYIYQKAQNLGVTGYVRNLSDGRVEVAAEGEQIQIDKLIEAAKKGPAFSHVTNVDVQPQLFGKNYSKFEITH